MSGIRTSLTAEEAMVVTAALLFYAFDEARFTTDPVSDVRHHLRNAARSGALPVRPDRIR